MPAGSAARMSCVNDLYRAAMLLDGKEKVYGSIPYQGSETAGHRPVPITEPTLFRGGAAVASGTELIAELAERFAYR